MRRLTRSTLLAALGATLLLSAACGDDDGGDNIEPAPDFTLPDGNEDSPTFGQDRTLSAAEGRVIVLFFALYT